MRKVKWIFFGYIGFILLTVLGIAVAFNAAPPRDPDTFYSPAYNGSLRSMDPAEIGDSLGSTILGQVFESLYNYKYNVVPFEIYPELASAMPVVSSDGLTMTIPVRHGIHYYDPDKTLWRDGVGPEVTAADFVYSFKRVCDSNLASGNYSFVFQDHFEGLNEWWAYTKAHPPKQDDARTSTVDYDRPVAGFTAPDRYTLVLKFTKPYPQMIYNLVNNPCSPVCRQIVEHWQDNVRMHPVGTGPYAMGEYLREQRITLVANPIYRGRPDVDGNTPVPAADRMPKVPRIQMDYFAEEMPVWLLFKQGLFDFEGIPKDAFGQAIGTGGDLTQDMVDRGVKIRKYPFPSTAYIGFNMNDPVLGKNKPLRQAMSMAFDRKAYIKKFLNGRGIPAIGPVPPGFPTYDAKIVNPYTEFNLDAARKLMVEAEKVNGGPIPDIKIWFRDATTLERQTADFYVDQMHQIGVTLSPQFRDFVRWQEMVDNRQAQMFDGGWDADYPDEQDFLQLFYGPNGDPQGLNAAAYQNPEFDALYLQAAVMQDTPERRAIYLKMQKMVEDDCPWITVSYEQVFRLYYDWVGNQIPMDYGHGYSQYITLDKALRSKRLGGGR